MHRKINLECIAYKEPNIVQDIFYNIIDMCQGCITIYEGLEVTFNYSDSLSCLILKKSDILALSMQLFSFYNSIVYFLKFVKLFDNY